MRDGVIVSVDGNTHCRPDSSKNWNKDEHEIGCPSKNLKFSKSSNPLPHGIALSKSKAAVNSPSIAERGFACRKTSAPVGTYKFLHKLEIAEPRTELS